ncbi:MAG: L-threonylcarbamoyladenylate synthase [Bacteroidota bacterium]
MQEIIDATINILNSGGIILYPTDTVWGIGCDATNHKAVEKIQKLKSRSSDKSFIVLVNNIKMLKDYVENFPEIAVDLIKSYHKPLTVVFPKGKNLASNVINADGSVAIRVVKNLFCENLILKLGVPIVSTSANLTGQQAPVTFNEISVQIKDAVDFIVQLNQEISNEVKPSTIIKFVNDTEFVVLRH